MTEFLMAFRGQLYLLVGLVNALVLIRSSREMPGDERSEAMGKLILLGLIGWPYVLVIWVFSCEVWLRPIKWRR